MAIVYLNSKEVGRTNPPPKAMRYNLVAIGWLPPHSPERRSGVEQMISKPRGVWHCWILPQTAKRWPDYCHKARNASPIIATSRETKSNAAKYA